MRELDPIRRAAPPVEPLAPEAVARIRARALTRRRPRRRALPLLAPVAVAAAALALVVALGGGADEEVPARPAPHGDAAAPRFLLDGWRVTRVDEWKAGTGEMTFERGGQVLELGWMPTSEAGPEGGMADKSGAPPDLEFGTAGGAPTRVWRHEQSDEYTAVWRQGDTTITARGKAASDAAFAGTLENLRLAGVGAWLRALPPAAVTPPERGDAVDAMLEGLPLPPGFDRARLRAGDATRDRYQLGVQVAGAVACGWIAAWAEAKASGDDAGVRRATAALASSHEWAILREMEAEGAYPEVVWQYADAVAGDGTVVGGKTLTVEESYQAALC